MSKNAVIGGVVVLALVCVLAGSIVTYQWADNENGPTAVPFGLDSNGNLPHNSINYELFENWGPVLLVLGTLMFGSIIAGVCISKEKEEKKGGKE